VKVDPKKLNDFIEETMPDKRHHRRPSPQEDDQGPVANVELAQANSPRWDGICLFSQDEPQPAIQP
jgi:hypothetical protein